MLNALSTDNSPFSERQLEALKGSIGVLDSAQSQWLSGYLAGRLASVESPSPHAAPAGRDIPALAVLYGSETGNGEAIATDLAADAEQAGLAAELHSLDGFRPANLKKLRHAAIIVSTHGEGDPPEEAVELFEFLDSDRAPDLSGLAYRVLALGDSSYEQFCAAGRRLDRRLRELGARPYGPRIECDVDYQVAADAWRREVLEDARERGPAPASAASAQLALVKDRPQWSRQQPFEAELIRVQKITGLGSTRDVNHLELSLEGSGLEYRPGDALGVWAPNDPELVDHLLSQTGVAPTAGVELRGRQLPVAEALSKHRELTRLSAETVESYARVGGQAELAERLDGLSGEARRAWIEQRQFADLADQFPATLEAQDLVDLLRPLSPRSYSIASSQTMVEEEAHLTVCTQYSNAIGKERWGVASGFLNRRLGQGGTVRIFPEPNRRFHLPDDPAAPLILIGAGTGIAPYRAFLQQLETIGANPDTWLVFGNPHLRTDFIYQREFLKWRETGLLDRIDAAWSRDQQDKRYVQHIVAEQAERLKDWLMRGAHVYICGGLPMGRAVQETLPVDVAELRRQGRLHRDLY